ncbi:hypothetical protein L6R50_11000 [Myxococcota bacterium]|nr:hypothetical protein [Myxococcota bacterium]
MRRLHLAAPLLVLATSCDERLRTDSGRIGVEVPDLQPAEEGDVAPVSPRCSARRGVLSSAP